MRSSIGLLPLAKILIFLLIFSFFPTNQALAEKIVSEEVRVYYKINENGKTSFNYLINLSTEPGISTAITQYTVSMPFDDLNISVLRSNGEDLQAQIEQEDGQKQLVLKFTNRLLNYTNPISIEIIGETKDKFMKELEGTRIIILPGTLSNIKVVDLEIRYPKSFGEIENYANQWEIEYLTDEIKLKSLKVGKTINLLWGNKIAYDFKITKTLSNSANEPTKTFELNVPKSQNNQSVIFSKITPLPSFAYQDGEKNIFFSYEVEPNSEINIEILGQVIINLEETKNTDLNFFEKPILTETTGYWLLNNEYELNRLTIYFSKEGITQDSVDRMEQSEKELFYKLAYDYVIDRLDFTNVRATSMESNIRQGANNAVLHRTSAAPEDYVDLLTAIYRLYDVPTRMIEGYVTIFNQGFYHSWLEFWDEQNGWKAIDPALQDYTNGNYFDTQLFNHITILSRGYNYIKPRMMFFDKDDLQINFPEFITYENLSIENIAKISPLKKSQNEILGVLEIKNTGNTLISTEKFANNQQLLLGNYNSLQLIVPEQTINVPFIFKADFKEKNERILLEYTSVNGDEVFNPVEINFHEEEFWWWVPLITTLKLTIVSIIVYIIYLISSRAFRWIKRYYQ